MSAGVFKNVLHGPCHRQVEAMLQDQLRRLQVSRYPDHLICPLAINLLPEGRVRTRTPDGECFKATAVTPYVHGVARRLKRADVRSAVRIAFPVPSKLRTLDKKVNYVDPRVKMCAKKHTRPFKSARLKQLKLSTRSLSPSPTPTLGKPVVEPTTTALASPLALQVILPAISDQ